MADHYTYVPCIGLFIMIIWGLSDLVTATAIPRVVPTAAALCLISVFAAVTTRYLSYWQNGVKLFTQASIVAGRPDPAIEAALGDSLVVDGRYDEAYQHYAQACLLRPVDDVCHYNLAEILFHRHQLRDALEQYQIAQSLTHSQDTVLTCLINSGEILLDVGDYQTAEMKLAAALQIAPNNSNALRLRERAFHQKSSANR
jgi:tetratricopeptide (TPR) repeat protein